MNRSDGSDVCYVKDRNDKCDESDDRGVMLVIIGWMLVMVVMSAIVVMLVMGMH